MLTKEKVVDSLRDLPPTFSIDDLVDKLLFLQKVEMGMEQSKQGETFSTENAKAMIEQWRSK